MQESTSNLTHPRSQSLFSMIVVVAVALIASTLLATSLSSKAHESKRSAALHAAKFALNKITADVSNSGTGLSNNGIVSEDSGVSTIRVRANLNDNDSLGDPDEDLRFIFQPDKHTLIRSDTYDPSHTDTILANNILNTRFFYLSADGSQITDPAKYSKARRITIHISATLPAEGNQPVSVVNLVSTAILKNAPTQ